MLVSLWSLNTGGKMLKTSTGNILQTEQVKQYCRITEHIKFSAFSFSAHETRLIKVTQHVQGFGVKTV